MYSSVRRISIWYGRFDGLPPYGRGLIKTRRRFADWWIPLIGVGPIAVQSGQRLSSLSFALPHRKTRWSTGILTCEFDSCKLFLVDRNQRGTAGWRLWCAGPVYGFCDFSWCCPDGCRWRSLTIANRTSYTKHRKRDKCRVTTDPGSQSDILQIR